MCRTQSNKSGLLPLSKDGYFQEPGKTVFPGEKSQRIAGPYRRSEDRMSAFAKVFGLASIVGAFLLFPAASGAEPLGAVRVRLAGGDGRGRIAETGEGAPVSVNMPLVGG